MPTEQEELRLTVSLADNASAGLTKLNEEIKQLGSGASQQQIEKFKRETQDVTRHVKGMSAEVGEAFKGLGMLRGGLAAGAAGLALFGYEMIRQTKAIIDYADKIRALNQQARAVGANPAQFKDVIEQLKAFGISGEQAASSIGAIQGKIAELQRRGSALRADLMAHAPDAAARRNMAAYIDQLTRAQTLAEQLNVMKQGGENVYRNTLERTHSEQRAAAARNEFWAKQSYDARLAEAGKLEELSKDEQRIASDRGKRAEELSNQMGQLTRKWETLTEEMKQPFISPVLTVLQGINSTLDLLIEKAQRFNERRDMRTKEEREQGTEISPETDYARRQKALENMRRERMGLPPIGESKEQTDAIKKNTSATEDLSNLLKLAVAGGGAGAGGGFGGGVIPAAYHPGGGLGRPTGAASFGGGGYTNLEAGGGSAPYGSSVGAGTGAGAGSTPAAGGGGGGAPSTKGPMTLGKGDDPRGMEPYIRETAKKYGVDPDTAVRVAKSEGLRDFLGDRGKSGGAFQLYTGGGLGNEFQKKTGLDPLDPKNEKATIDYALSNVGKTGWGPYHGAARVGVGRREGIGISGQTAGPGSGAGAGGSMAGGSVPKPVLDEAKALLIRGGGSGELQQFMRSKGYPRSGAWCGQFTASVVTEAGGQPPRNAAVASNWLTWGEHVDPGNVKEGDVAVRTRSRYGGAAVPGQTGSHVGLVGGVGDKTIDMVGGNQGRPVASRNRWSGEWEFRRAQMDRAQLDRTQAASTKVEGTGKISVDVNAPKGTNVGAEGGGLFKKVEISRQTQMSEAKRGPAGGYATEQFLQ